MSARRNRKKHPLRRDVPDPVPYLVPVRPDPSPPVLVPDAPVTVEWDPTRSVYAAVCHRCLDQVDAFVLADAHEWATGHDCDPELAALLAEVTGGIAA